MKNLRKFRIFLLFIALFSAVAYATFGGYLEDIAGILRTGRGTTRFELAVRGADSNVYALGRRDGLRLVGLNEGGRLFERTLKKGLPEEFVIDDLHVTAGGAILISLYESARGELHYGLFVAEDGESFRPLIREKCSGSTLQERKRSVMLSSMSETDAKVRFFLKKGTQCDRYAFNVGSEDGLELESPFMLDKDKVMAAGIVIGDSAYVAFTDGTLAEATDFGLAELSGGAIYTRLMQFAGGFRYIDAKSGALVLFDVDTKSGRAELGLLGGALPAAPEAIVWLSTDMDGGCLVLSNYDTLYSVSPEGAALDMTPLLYRGAVESAAMFALFVIVILFLSYSFFYLFSEVRKLYFPIVLRNALALTLLAAALTGAALRFFIGPAFLGDSSRMVQTTLATYVGQLAKGELDPDAAVKLLFEINPDFERTEFLELSAADGEWRVVKSTGERYANGTIVRAPGVLGGLPRGAELRAAHSERVETPDSILYLAYAPTGADTALVVVTDATRMEEGFERDLERVALWMFGCAGAVVLLALLALAKVTRGLRRIMRGVDIMSAGRFDVSVVQNTGDEMEALAGSFNALADSLGRQFTGAKRRSESFLQFVPQQMVTLLGARSIEDIDKSTASSADMAMMVVWLGLPERVYESDPKTLFDDINEVIERTSGIVAKNGGTIYNFTSHGYDTVFRSGSEAVSTAVEIRQEIIALNEERAERGGSPVTLRVAVDQGNMMMGVVGDERHMVPTVVSACLNRARMLVNLSHTLDANILCTLAVAEVASEYALRYIGKGRDGDDVLRVYEIFDGDPYDIRVAKETTREQFSEGVYLIYSHSLAAAKRIFMDIARRYSGDGVTRYYLYLADKYEKEEPEGIYLN